MATMKIFLLLVATFAFTKGEVNTEPKCGDVRPGRYCNKDLSGFIFCGENGEMGTSSCSSQYRCPCGFNNRCEEDAKCVIKPNFVDSEIPSDFTVCFTSKRTFSSPTDFKDQSANGIIHQDTTPGDEKFAFMKTVTDNLNNDAFVIVLERVLRKDASGNFVQVRLIRKYACFF